MNMKFSLLFIAIFLFTSCGDKIKSESRLVWVKGISYGFATDTKMAGIEAKKNMGGFLVGVKYHYSAGQLKVSSDGFQSSLSPTANIGDMKKGSLKNGLKYEQFPVSAQVRRPVKMPRATSGTVGVKENGSYYYPMINQVLQDKYGKTPGNRSGIIYINELKYIENPADQNKAPWGVIQYKLYVVED